MNNKSILLAVFIAAFAGKVMSADSPTGASGTLDAIVVTAQKREQNLQTVGTSITAFDGAALKKLGVTDVTAISNQTPGMQFNQYGATVTVYNLRGVSQNDFSDHQEAPIAVYADDAYVASMGALAGSLFDIQRVEVLRGPQGTLFGRNATGGLIHYISEKPKFDDDGYVSATGGNFGTLNTEGAFNHAFSDRLAVRASFGTDYHDGYIKNRIGPSINNQKQYAGRVQFLYKPNERGEIRLKIHGVVNDNETAGNYSWAASVGDSTGRGMFAPGTADAGGYINPSSDPFNQAEDRRGIFNRTVLGATLHVTWNFDPFTLTSVSDYLHLQKRYGEDSDISPNTIFNYDTLQHYRQLAQELRLNGNAGALNWMTGIYFLGYHTSNDEKLYFPAGFGGPSDASFTLTTQSQSAFGQLEYDFNPHWTAIGGVRITSDQKTYDYNYQPQNLIYVEGKDPGAKHTYNNVTGKLELDYRFDTGSMLYASVNRGAKGGGWSAPSSGVVDPAALPFTQETLTSYEAGEKLTFWDGRARLNGSVFYYDYKNYQGFFLVGLTQVVKNVDATVKGGELEFAVAPVQGMNLQLGISHLETVAKNVPLATGAFINTELPQSPKWSLNAVARYELPIPGGQLAIEADTKWNAREYLELLNAPVDYQASYALSNARVTYSNNAHWDLSAWVKNLSNKYYRVYNLDLSPLGFNQGVYGPPRTFGVTVNYWWGSK